MQVADALAAAHAAGIIHRDLKPGNLMVNDEGRVKVLDFGLAKLTDTTEVSEWDGTRTFDAESPRSAAGAIVGTASYMSPEQADGRKIDPRSDIFAFGAMLYEILTGRRAFQGESHISTLASIIHKNPRPIGEVPAPSLGIWKRSFSAECVRIPTAASSTRVLGGRSYSWCSLSGCRQGTSRDICRGWLPDNASAWRADAAGLAWPKPAPPCNNVSGR